MKITTRKPANLVDFFQKITAAHHPEAACSIVALAHKTDANFQEISRFFSECIKFLKFASLGRENYRQKTSKSGGFFSWKSLPLERKASRYNEKPQKTTNFSKILQKLFKNHKSLNFLCDIAEWPMVSLGQERLGGANHSQKTSKSGGVFPANRLLWQEIPFGKRKTQTNYQMCKKFRNFDKSPLFNRFLWHNMAPVRPKITSRNQKGYKIFCILGT